MRKIILMTVLAALTPFLFFSSVEAKRAGAPKVEPLVYKGVKFIAPNTPQRMGYVEAWDTVTNTKVWEKKVYSVFINPIMEQDVQWLFIKSLSIEDNKLMVIDEEGQVYKLDIPVNILKEGDFQLPTGEKQNTIIKVGMVFEEAEKVLEEFGAVETNMDIMPVESSTGGYMEVACYVLGKTPAIIINYEQKNEKNIIQVLALYYEYGYKTDPRNRWKNVEEIDLRNIPPVPK